MAVVGYPRDADGLVEFRPWCARHGQWPVPLAKRCAGGRGLREFGLIRKRRPRTRPHLPKPSLLAHFGIGHAARRHRLSLAAMLPSLAIMETRKMPSTAIRTWSSSSGCRMATSACSTPGFGLPAGAADWNRIAGHLSCRWRFSEQAGSPKKAAAEVVTELASLVRQDGWRGEAKHPKTAVVKAAAESPNRSQRRRLAPVTPIGSAEGGGVVASFGSQRPRRFAGDTSEETATESGTGNESSEGSP